MQRALTDSSAGSCDFDSTAEFNILTVYEDFAAGTRAKRTCDFLNQELGPEYLMTHQMWKFAVLNIPKLREMAVQDAIRSNIIIVASSANDLPDCVKDWVEGWLLQPNEVVALVALEDPEAEAAPGSIAARTYLEQAANRSGLEFFAQTHDWPERIPIDLFRGNQKPRGFTNFKRAIHPDSPFTGWGINE